eukprot:2543243-Prymnesium_polylepis.3
MESPPPSSLEFVCGEPTVNGESTVDDSRESRWAFGECGVCLIAAAGSCMLARAPLSTWWSARRRGSRSTRKSLALQEYVHAVSPVWPRVADGR